MLLCQQGGPSPATLDTASSNSHVTWLNKRQIKSFYHGVVANDLRTGVKMLLQVGRLPSLIYQVHFIMWFRRIYRMCYTVSNSRVQVWVGSGQMSS